MSITLLFFHITRVVYSSDSILHPRFFTEEVGIEYLSIDTTSAKTAFCVH